MVEQLVRDRVALEPELVVTRRALHQQPELAFAEHRTAELVADRLRALGLAPRTGVGGTGVIADIDGGRPGPTLLLRADMDALPLEETPGRTYGSQISGRMHACGHDAHTSALLGVASLLAPRAQSLAGRVRLLFQPAEEVGAGALAVISDGRLTVSMKPLARTCSVWFRSAWSARALVTFWSAQLFELVVMGGGGHSGMPHEARDAVFAAAQLVSTLQSISRETSTAEMLTLTVASIDGGTAANVIASTVTLRGTLRWLDPTVRDRALARMEDIAAGVCVGLRVSHELRVPATLPVLRCHEGPTALLAQAAESAGASVIDPGVIPAREDFANVAERIPTGFIMVGAGGEGYGMHHAPEFDIDERAIGLTTEILTRAALTRLNNDGSPPGPG